jgi:hypothetical protein
MQLESREGRQPGYPTTTIQETEAESTSRGAAINLSKDARPHLKLGHRH